MAGQDSHPCNGCENLKWDSVNARHGTSVWIPFCNLDNSTPVARCEEYPSKADSQVPSGSPEKEGQEPG